MVYILLAPVGRRNLINLICSLSFAVVLRNQLPPFPSLVPSSVIESSVNACVNIQSSIYLRFSERAKRYGVPENLDFWGEEEVLRP